MKRRGVREKDAARCARLLAGEQAALAGGVDPRDENLASCIPYRIVSRIRSLLGKGQKSWCIRVVGLVQQDQAAS